MKSSLYLFIGLMLISSQCFALSSKKVREIIEAAYPGAKITEIEKEFYRGQKIIEVDFSHKGEKLEAIISLDGEIIKVVIDD